MIRARRRAEDPVEAREIVEVVVDREALIEAGRLRHDGDAAPELRAVAVFHGDAGDLGCAGAGPHDRAERSDRRCLARAVGAEEAEDLPDPHLEGQILKRRAFTEALREMGCAYGGPDDSKVHARICSTARAWGQVIVILPHIPWQTPPKR